MASNEQARVAVALQQLSTARADNKVAETTERNVRLWLTDPSYAKVRELVLEHMEQGKFKELDDVFWTILPFGTGGRRGKMYPIGTNAMNDRTVGESAQGLATYLRQVHGPSKQLSCVIAHDTRNNSEHFARLSAAVLAGNGVQVYVFRGYRSTPQLSFAVRQLQASAGIVISASHNPPGDNGFKCYWSNGAQVIEPHDHGIIQCVEGVREIREIDFETGIRQGLIKWLGPEDDQAYIDAVVAQARGVERNIRIVYTPLHGVGMTSVFRALETAGFRNIRVVQSQAIPDGNFPNVANHAPNPENPAALEQAIDMAIHERADLVLASDPDADRIAAAVPDATGLRCIPLTGNQTAALLTHYVISKWAMRSGKEAEKSKFVVKTLVTTELMARIADAHQARTIGDLPVGFKWIAQAMDENGPADFLFGSEESLGYLAGDYARDKDAAIAALLFSELAAELKASSQTVLEHLDDLYRRYGLHVEMAVSKSRPGRAGAAEIASIMQAFRNNPPEIMGGMRVDRIHDFVAGELRARTMTERQPLKGQRQQQVMLEFDRPGWRLVARPSGTEPKIKFYLFGVVPAEQLTSPAALTTAKAEAAAAMQRLTDDLNRFADESARL